MGKLGEGLGTRLLPYHKPLSFTHLTFTDLLTTSPIAGLYYGLDCGLVHWTGLLDWITGLTSELKLCVSHDLHPIRCAELGNTFNA